MLKLKSWSVGALLIAATYGLTAAAEPIAPGGAQLATFLDQMHVESLWQAGSVVDWETGKALRPAHDDRAHTHCSAFVAAAAQRLGIYILRPPAHSPKLLANAQAAWLASDGTAQGWRLVTTDDEAQAAANRGEFVVAVFANPKSDAPGHIAVLRPSTRTAAELAAHGPSIAQAGMTNANDTTVESGFAHHKGAWTEHKLHYYAHAVVWPQRPATAPKGGG